MSFKLSEKVTLEVGDKIRVSSGPYYPSQDGTKLKMGEKGIGTFTGVDDQKKAYTFNLTKSVLPVMFILVRNTFQNQPEWFLGLIKSLS